MANNKNNKVPSRLRETLILDFFSAFLFLLHFHEFASRRDETLTFGGISLIFGPCFCKVPDPTKNANLRLVHARREFPLSEMAFLLRSIVKTCVSSRRNASFRILCCLSSIWYIFGNFQKLAFRLREMLTLGGSQHLLCRGVAVTGNWREVLCLARSQRQLQNLPKRAPGRPEPEMSKLSMEKCIILKGQMSLIFCWKSGGPREVQNPALELVGIAHLVLVLVLLCCWQC